MLVEVTALPGDRFRAVVEGRSVHEVHARPAVVARIARDGETGVDVVRRAFDFLLAREGPGSILSSFALEDIARYFPDFWEAMG